MSRLTSIARPKLALPFTIVTQGESVCLVAGEDFRYKISAHLSAAWLSPLLAACDGSRPLTELLKQVPEPHREAALGVVDQLYGERVLVDGTAADAHRAKVLGLQAEGSSPLVQLLRLSQDCDPQGEFVRVLCQDRLDYQEAFEFNRRCLSQGVPSLWVSTGPMTRGFVSPLFLPDAGSCLACLLGHFQRLSPAPAIYDALREYSSHGGVVEPVPFPAHGTEILGHLVRWKLELAAQEQPPAALYRLHVLEVGTLEISVHRVFADPECPDCVARV